MTVSRRAVGVSLVCALAGLGVGVATSGASATSQPSASEAGARAPELVLVKFHADWCPRCRALDPVFDQVEVDQATSKVLFVRLDKTNKATALQAEYLSTELGLGQHWPEYGRKTGLMVLFDAKTGKVVREFSAGANSGEVNEAIAAAAG
ncbi:MAG: thioredoxin domain-containing protein [Planctomycetota bacterium]